MLYHENAKMQIIGSLGIKVLAESTNIIISKIMSIEETKSLIGKLVTARELDLLLKEKFTICHCCSHFSVKSPYEKISIKSLKFKSNYQQ